MTLEQGVTYVPEGNYYEENTPEIEKAVEAAGNVDVIIACIGENSYCETPGNLSDLRLSANQRDLVKALAKTGKPIVLILNEGRPRIISDIEPLAEAVIDILLPGNYGADALANILSGKANPSAKMPYTYPKDPAALTTYDYRVSDGQDGRRLRLRCRDIRAVAVRLRTELHHVQLRQLQDLRHRFQGRRQYHPVCRCHQHRNRCRQGSGDALQPRHGCVAHSGEQTPESIPEDRAQTRRDTHRLVQSEMQAGDKTLNLECTETYKWNTQNR